MALQIDGLILLGREKGAVMKELTVIRERQWRAGTMLVLVATLGLASPGVVLAQAAKAAATAAADLEALSRLPKPRAN